MNTTTDENGMGDHAIVYFVRILTKNKNPVSKKKQCSVYTCVIILRGKICTATLENRPIQQTNALSVTWPTVDQQKICCVLSYSTVLQCTAFNCSNNGTIKSTSFH